MNLKKKKYIKAKKVKKLKTELINWYQTDTMVY